MTYTIAAFYRFVPVAEPVSVRLSLKEAFQRLDLCGSLLIASEGINGTLAGSAQAIDQMLDILADRFQLSRNEVKLSESPHKPFSRLKIRLKREIITFNQPAADPNRATGTYVDPKEWNNLLNDPDAIIVDTRNTYEVMIGTFQGAQNPNIRQFTDFATYVREKLAPAKNKRIGIFCTGGIRCEKAAAFMIAEGFTNVAQLKGGILKYLEEIPAEKSQWQGECYVFDQRMAVGHGLTTGRYSMSFCCGSPLTEEDKKEHSFEEGASCKYCYARTSEADKNRFRMRHQQMMQTQDKNGSLA